MHISGESEGACSDEGEGACSDEGEGEAVRLCRGCTQW